MDLLINAVLTASSVALFCYWFRYGCLLILAAETLRDYSEEVVERESAIFSRGAIQAAEAKCH